jgi:hypothetical protein
MTDPATPADAVPSPGAVPEPEEPDEPSRSEQEAREVADIVGRLGDDDLGRAERARQLVALSSVVAARARRAGASAVGSGRMLGDLLLDAAPHLPIRDLPTLSAHHHGLTGEALAEALVRNAVRATMGIGAAGGAVAAAEWAALPSASCTRSTASTSRGRARSARPRSPAPGPRGAGSTPCDPGRSPTSWASPGASSSPSA